ncbi:MAG: TIGR04282 family arsenosugar biosynthesis glycosyltransferase [bacterium]
MIFVKYPEPGKVKTRLGSEIGFQEAASLYRLFMEQTFELAQRSSAEKKYVAFAPGDREASFSEIIPESFELVPQDGRTLGARMLNAFQCTFEAGADGTVILGSDSPTLPLQFLEAAFATLTKHDLVLGPAEDGGYYLIGMKEYHPGIFESIEWSSSSVLETTLRKAKESQLRTKLLKTWYDIDDKPTLVRAANDDRSGRIQAFLQTQLDTFPRDK